MLFERVLLYTPAQMMLDVDRAKELEQIYDELSSTPRRHQWIARRRHPQRRQELSGRQQHLLEEVGCDSWTDYMLKICSTPVATSV